MRKMRFLLRVLTMALLLAACGAEKAAPAVQTVPAAVQETTQPTAEPVVDERTVITAVVARHSEQTGQWWAELEKTYEAANPEFNLEVTCVSWHDIDAVIRERITAGDLPDLVNTDQLRQYQKEGLLLPARQWVSQETYSKFYPSLHVRAEADGVVWGVPDFVSAHAMYYNADILHAAEVEVPTTWRELVSACQAIRGYDHALYPWGVDMTTDEGYACFAYYVWNNGSDLMDAKGNWTLDDPKNLYAVEFITDMVQKRLTNPDPTSETRYQCQEWFGQGKVAMMIAPSSLPDYCAASGSTVNYGIAPLPANSGSPSVSTATGNFLMCFADESRTDRELAAITALADAIYEDTAYTQWVRAERFLPATTTGNAILGAQDPHMAVWNEILGSLKFYPADRELWAIVRQDIVAMLQKIQWEGNIWLQLDRLQRGAVNP